MLHYPDREVYKNQAMPKYTTKRTHTNIKHKFMEDSPLSISLVKNNNKSNGIYALGKSHMRSTPSLRSFPNVAFETVPLCI